MTTALVIGTTVTYMNCGSNQQPVRENKMTKPDVISLALGGGGARGISHVHVLKAIDDLGVEVREIAGSSIGAIVGAGYCGGMSGADIEAFFRAAFSDRTAAFAKLWKITPSVMSAFAKSGSGPFGQMDVEKVLDAFLPTELPHDFKDLRIPITITGTDYYGNRLVKLTSGDLRKAIAASAAIPVVFKPVIIDGCVLIDGGIHNPLPFDLLDASKAHIVAVDVVGLPKGEPGTIPGRVDAAFGASQLMMQAVTTLKLHENPPELFLRPPVDHYRVLDFLKVKEILEETADVYEETKRGLERVFAPSKSGVSA